MYTLVKEKESSMDTSNLSLISSATATSHLNDVYLLLQGLM